MLADLEGVDFVDSAGLGSLLWGMKRLREIGGEPSAAEPEAVFVTAIDDLAISCTPE